MKRAYLFSTTYMGLTLLGPYLHQTITTIVYEKQGARRRVPKNRDVFRIVECEDPKAVLKAYWDAEAKHEETVERLEAELDAARTLRRREALAAFEAAGRILPIDSFKEAAE